MQSYVIASEAKQSHKTNEKNRIFHNGLLRWAGNDIIYLMKIALIP